MPSSRTQALATTALFMLSAAVSAGQTFTVIQRFKGTNGTSPLAPLTQGIDGSLYGTTAGGGTRLNGTAFKVTPAGALTTLYNFCSLLPCIDGSSPEAGLVQGADGRFYGTASDGGRSVGGTVFRMSPQGALRTLFSFCLAVSCADGAQPVAPLVAGSDGNFYGTTLGGGTNGDHGTIFQIRTDGAGELITLHSFCAEPGCADGAQPRAGLIEAGDGHFYGTTETEGAHQAGTVFKITSEGELATLYSFCADEGCRDGAGPQAGVIEGGGGNFYGVTTSGGDAAKCASGCGTIFKLTPEGTLSTLHRFHLTDGSAPIGLLQATDGNFYGVTKSGGVHNRGTIFQLTADGTFAVLHSFTIADGFQPLAGLLQATDGNFYGTTALGGPENGTIFRLSMGLDPFVKTLPMAARVGQRVLILGNNLTNATNVAFNGVSGNFTVLSRTLIAAVVPTGATTGPVQVITSEGTLSTHSAFRVIQ